jgi:hypothetical protein
MENLCYFVNSRGILKSCSFHSPNPKSSCDDDKKYLYTMLDKMFDGMSIYVCSDLLQFFLEYILPKINKRFVLVSGDSDLCVPLEAFEKQGQNFLNLINSQYLVKWFVQNTRLQFYNKIIQLPIGLDYHTISNNPSSNWKLPEESSYPRDQELVLVNLREKAKPFYERIPKIYVNFSKGNDRFGHRKTSLESINPHLLEINDTFTPRTLNWNTTINYTFVLSPFGNGMDCHRTWEALCLGSIPIVKAPNFKKMFQDLPVLVVNDWKEINKELLDSTINTFKNTEFNYDKLTLKYWVNKIKG